MTDLPRYLVAKYISDLQRMEPRNIGVILSTPAGVCARFAAEKRDAPGEIDGRSIPPFVTSTAAYKQWVDFWRTELTTKSQEDGSPEKWFEELKQTSHGNFCLVDGGVFLDKIDRKHLSELTDDLFHRLVVSSSGDEQRDPVLDRVVDDLIKKLRLTENAAFHSRVQIPCRVASNVVEHFEFSHAYKNGRVKRLYQRVPLSRRQTPLRRVVHDSAWMFEKVVNDKIVRRDDAIALLYASDEQKCDPEVSWSFDVLGSVARLVNLADSNEALAAFVVE